MISCGPTDATFRSLGRISSIQSSRRLLRHRLVLGGSVDDLTRGEQNRSVFYYTRTMFGTYSRPHWRRRHRALKPVPLPSSSSSSSRDKQVAPRQRRRSWRFWQSRREEGGGIAAKREERQKKRRSIRATDYSLPALVLWLVGTVLIIVRPWGCRRVTMVAQRCMLAEMVPALSGGPSPCLSRLRVTPSSAGSTRRGLLRWRDAEAKTVSELAQEPVPRHFCVNNIYPAWAARRIWSRDAWPLWEEDSGASGDGG